MDDKLAGLLAELAAAVAVIEAINRSSLVYWDCPSVFEAIAKYEAVRNDSN